MKATDDLMHEHEAVLDALRILDRVAAAILTKDAEAPSHLAQLLDFFKGFVDRCHHSKEEDVLFPELERRGVSRQGGPIGVMLSEHEQGRGHVRELDASLGRLRDGDAGAAASIRELAVAYRHLLQQHIDKENHILFPLADRLLAEMDDKLNEEFETIERERVGQGKHEAYHAMLRTLHGHYGVA